MIRIACPHCGVRDALEFTWGGQADLARPANPGLCSDLEWGVYLFFRRNPKGMHHERWCHTYGCGQWLNVWRHTVTHVIERVTSMDAPGTSLSPPP